MAVQEGAEEGRAEGEAEQQQSGLMTRGGGLPDTQT